MTKKLVTLIAVEIDLPEEQTTEAILNDYKDRVYKLIKNETDDSAKITVSIAVKD